MNFVRELKIFPRMQRIFMFNKARFIYYICNGSFCFVDEDKTKAAIFI